MLTLLTNTPKFFSSEQFILCLACDCAWIVQTHVEDLALGIFKLTSQTCPGPPWYQPFPPVCQAHHTAVNKPLKFKNKPVLKVHSIPLSIFLTKISNSADPNAQPWGPPLLHSSTQLLPKMNPFNTWPCFMADLCIFIFTHELSSWYFLPLSF